MKSFSRSSSTSKVPASIKRHVLHASHQKEICSLCNPENPIIPLKEESARTAFYSWLDHHKTTTSWIPKQEGKLLLERFFKAFLESYGTQGTFIEQATALDYQLISSCGLQPSLGTLGMESLFGVGSLLKESVFKDITEVVFAANLLALDLEYLIALATAEGSSVFSWFNSNSQLDCLYNIFFFLESLFNEEPERLASRAIQQKDASLPLEGGLHFQVLDQDLLCKNFRVLKKDHAIPLATLFSRLLGSLLDSDNRWKNFLVSWIPKPIPPSIPNELPFRHWDLSEGKERFDLILVGLAETLLSFITTLHGRRISVISISAYQLLENCLHTLASLFSVGLIKLDWLQKLGVPDILSSFLGWPPFILCYDGNLSSFFATKLDPGILQSEFKIQVCSWRLLDYFGAMEPLVCPNLARRLTGSSVVDMFCWVFYFSASNQDGSDFQSGPNSYPLLSQFPEKGDGGHVLDLSRMSLVDDFPDYTEMHYSSQLSKCIQEYLLRKQILINAQTTVKPSSWVEYNPPTISPEQWTQTPELEILFYTMFTFCLKESLAFGANASKNSKPEENKALDYILLHDFTTDSSEAETFAHSSPPTLWKLAIDTVMELFGRFDDTHLSQARIGNSRLVGTESIEMEHDLHRQEILHTYVRHALARKPSVSQRIYVPALQFHLLGFLSCLLHPVHDRLLHQLCDFPYSGDSVQIIKPLTLLHRRWCHQLFGESGLLDLLCSEFFFCWGVRAPAKASAYQPPAMARHLQQAVVDFIVYAGTLPEINNRPVYSKLLALLSITVHLKDSRGILLVARGLYRILKYNHAAVQSSLKHMQFFESLLPALALVKPSLAFDQLQLSEDVMFQLSAFWMLVSVLDFGLLQHQELSLLALRHPPALQCLLEFLGSEILDLVKLAITHINNIIVIGSVEQPMPPSSAVSLPQLLAGEAPSQPIEGLVFHYLGATSKKQTFDLPGLILAGVRASVAYYPAFSQSRKAVQSAFAAGRSFEQLFVLLELAPASHTHASDFIAEIISTFTALLQQNDRFKMELARNDGYARLCIAILDSEGPLNQFTFDALFGMMVDQTWSEDASSIANKYVIAILMDLFSTMTPGMQLELMDRMARLATASDINKWALCNSSIISKLLRSPIPPKEAAMYVVKTMTLLELLGSYSVTIADVKLLLSSLCFDRHDGTEVGSQLYMASHHFSLLEVLYEISQHTNDLSFFQFKGRGSGLQVHHVKFPSAGFTFFTWVKLEPNHPQPQVLFYFADQPGSVLTAYFDRGSLSYRLLLPSGKDETVVSRYKFTVGRWYFVAVSHSCSKFGWGFGQPEVAIYVDGDICSQVQLDYPSLQASSFRGFVGAEPIEDAPRLEAGVRLGGDYLASSLCGQLATIYLASSALSPSQITTIFSLGREHSSLFLSKETGGVQTASAPDRALQIIPPPKLVFAFHSLASKGSLCYNLQFQTSPTSHPEADLHATLTRVEKCSTLSLQNALHALGGMEVLFPLLLKLDSPATIPPPPSELQTNFFLQKGTSPAFFALIASLLKGHSENQRCFLHSNGVRIIAHLLMHAHPSHLTVPTYQAIVALATTVEDNTALCSHIYHGLLFNMRIWMYSSFEAQAYILGLIKNTIDARRAHFGNEFHVIFFFDTLRTCYYYTPDIYAMSETHPEFGTPRPTDRAHLFQLRSILLDVIQSFLREAQGPDAAQSVSRHLLSSKDDQHSAEVLGLVLDIFRADMDMPLLKLFLHSKGYETLCALLQRPCNSLRALVYDTLSFFIAHPKIPERWKARMQAADIHTVIFAYPQLRLDNRAYYSMLRFALNNPPASLKQDQLEPGDSVRIPAILISLLMLLQVQGTSEQLREQVLGDIGELCSRDVKLCLELIHSDKFLPSIMALLPIPRSGEDKFESSADGSPVISNSSQLVLGLLCTIAVACLGPETRSTAASRFVGEVVYLWWSSSSIHCRQSGATFQRDDFRLPYLNASSPEARRHATTLALIRQFLGLLATRLEAEIENTQPTERWLEGALGIQNLIDTILFHHWELEEAVFGRLVGLGADDPIKAFKRLSDPNLPLLDDIVAENLVHQLPNNPWEESLELTMPFFSLLNQLDRLLGSLNSIRRRSTVYASSPSPCQTMLRILAAGFEVKDPSLLGIVRSYLEMFTDRHRCHPPGTPQHPAYVCPFTHTIQDQLPFLLGCIQEAFSSATPDDAEYRLLLAMYHISIHAWRDAMPLTEALKGWNGSCDTLAQAISMPAWDAMCGETFFRATKRAVEDEFVRFSTQANEINQGVNGLIRKMRREASEFARDEIRLRSIIENAISGHIAAETARMAGAEVERKSTLNRVARLWLVKLQELTREHGVGLGPPNWKLDFTENYSRMRRRLTINHEFNSHQEASAKRDKTPPKPPSEFGPWKRTSINNYLTRASSRAERIKERLGNAEISSNDTGDIDSLLSTDSEDAEWSVVTADDTGPAYDTPKERVLCEADCSLIFLLATIHGRLRLTHTHLYFFIDRQRILEELATPHSTVTIDWDMIRDRRWRTSDLREIRHRNHMLRRSALEFFFADQSAFFFNFPATGDRQKVCSHLPKSKCTALPGEARLSDLTQQWQRHEISNFDYLMKLNSIAGRTYNDLTQYFIFPWILADYESDVLDLDDPAVYRDLSKPMGAIDPVRRKQCIERYNEFEDPSGRVKKFHHGTHYSSAAAVAFYLLRLEPFTSIHVALQSGKFDHADRQFRSIQSCWHSCLKGLGDVKELIPEFFYLPEFLRNSNRFDLGCTQDGAPLNDVGLPPWAESPEHFIRLHREALESEYVSQSLHHWIDLIFGFKQTGPEAVKALNLFYYLTYEGAVDLDAISDPLERRSIQEQIYHFGQTPTQLLTSPHPQRRPRPTLPPRIYHCDPHRWRIGSDGYKTYLLKLPAKSIAFLTVCSPQARIVTVDSHGLIGCHVPLARASSGSGMPFKMDPKQVTQPGHQIPSPFAHHARITPKSFAATTNGQYIISTCHWDNTFKVIETATGRPMASVGGHGDLVTCVALGEDGTTFVTGSRSSNVFSWSLTDSSHIAPSTSLTKRRHSRLRSSSFDNPKGQLQKPFTNSAILCHHHDLAFYGHGDAVVCVAVNVEHDILASGSKDGACIIHSLRQGLYLRSLVPHGQSCSSGAIIQHIMITSEAFIIICSELQVIPSPPPV
ncbi:hypothetical protein DSO57_1008753 [Entomophthora muscae]|uniref:Uncharacterized protein n=1 Tax=Entomophthora muscae TaxID=34485 RepID=A0ACC2THP3_9FUNG|nr:hypothetical protein DSO57_1008753 [Entomophthora muscae]